jgi:hypothetical protein
MLSVTDTDITVIKRVRTKRGYYGISGGRVDNTLIVSCRKDTDGLASVDIINRKGKIVKTVTDSDRLAGLEEPDYLYIRGLRAFISESRYNKCSLWTRTVAPFWKLSLAIT